MSRRRLRRRVEKAQRHEQPQAPTASREVVRAVRSVERLAYSRTQAAEALGVSRATFDRRVLPLLGTIDLPWGTRLLPVDELERVIADCRRPARGRTAAASRGRPKAIPIEVAHRIAAEHRSGLSLGQIARRLDADGVRPVQGGRRWWPSTVRSVLQRLA